MPSSPPPKNIKVEAHSPSPELDPQTALEEEIAENQVMRRVIPDLSQAVAVLMKDRGALMDKQARAHEELLKQIMTLPKEDQERFERPLAKSSSVMNKTAATDNQVTGLVDEVRRRLIEMGLGGLLVAMDREFCIPIAEAPEDDLRKSFDYNTKSEEYTLGYVIMTHGLTAGYTRAAIG